MNKMHVNDLLPKDKSDIDTAYQLKNYDYSEIKPIIPKLMEWLQDMNWPVSKIVADYLLSFQDKLETEIMFVLNSNDGMWKYWIICIFGNKTTNKKIQEKIIEIAENPTDDEIECEVNILAKDTIENAEWIK